MTRRAVILAVVLCVLASPSAASAMPDGGVQPRIVGGEPVASIEDAAYQVALLDPQRADDQFCGGSILDATHVVTAAHCVTDEQTGDALPPGDTAVLAGTIDVQDRTAPAERVGVAAVSVHPEFDPVRQTNDVALLTLAHPLDLSGPSKKALAPAAARSPAGTTALVTGWGSTVDGGPGERDLQKATVDVVADDAPTCAGAAPYGFSAEEQGLLLCAAAPDRDSCRGDSGGPLVAGGELIGIVSFGEGCADSRYAGVYTEVAAPSVHDFITGVLPSPAPDAPPLLEGTPLVGQTLTCRPGTWSFEPTFRYSFFAVGSPSTVLRGPDASPTYTLTDGDANRTVGCVVEATSTSGAVRTEPSNTVGPVRRQTVTTVVTVTPPPVTDTTAPRSTVVARRCSRTTCRTDVLVEDPGYSTGVQGVAMTWTSRWRVTCRKNGRRTTCLRSRSGAATFTSLGRNLFAVRLRDLRPGSRTVLTITATDRAGNTERPSLITVLRTTRAPAPSRRS